ncbi:MAG: hypothetical protein D6805_08555 [Planctomycetota bacterium]|nr:MAG: hypothetical protein D6805_08555 [Planctomycetota bacterium]
MKYSIFALMLVSLVFVGLGCPKKKGNKNQGKNQSKKDEHKHKYYCAMKCISKKPGKCPKCKADLKKNDKGIFVCPKGCIKYYDQEGKCEVCGMKLKVKDDHKDKKGNKDKGKNKS